MGHGVCVCENQPPPAPSSLPSLQAGHFCSKASWAFLFWVGGGTNYSRRGHIASANSLSEGVEEDRMERSTLLVQAFMGSFIYAQPLSLSFTLSPSLSQPPFHPLLLLRLDLWLASELWALKQRMKRRSHCLYLKHRLLWHSTGSVPKSPRKQPMSKQDKKERRFQADSTCAVIATARPQAWGLEEQPGSDSLLSAVGSVRWLLGGSHLELSLYNHPLSDLKESNYISSVLFIRQWKTSVHNLDTSVCVNISLKLMRLRGCGNAGGGKSQMFALSI